MLKAAFGFAVPGFLSSGSRWNSLPSPSRRCPSARVKMSAGPVSVPSTANTASLVGSNAVFAFCMLRIKDPAKSRAFYEGKLGMKYLTCLDFEDLRFSLHFFAYTDDEVPDPSLSQAERASWLFSRPYPKMELTHNWDGEEVLTNGNVKSEGRGFGHTGFLVDSAAECVKTLEESGVTVVRPAGPFLDVGNIAFVEDPDKYWCEIIEKSEVRDDRPVFAQTMLRIKDPLKSIAFFQQLGMKYLLQLDFPEFEFSLYFLAYTDVPLPPQDASRVEKANWLWKFRDITVELTHNWIDDGEQYTNGNGSNGKPRGFGQLGIVVSDVYDATQKMSDAGHTIVRPASPFEDVGILSFVASPGESYRVELMQRPVQS